MTGARPILAGALLLCVAAAAHAQMTGGSGAVALDPSGIAYGNTAYSGGLDAVAIGDTSTAYTNHSTAIGSHARAMSVSATALGDTAQAIAYQSLALGANSMATFNNSIALGAGSVTLFGVQLGYAAYGLSTPQSSSGEVNVGNRTISTLAPGRADQDAVNVAQLRAVKSELGAATRADGAVRYDRAPDGSINHDSVTLQGNPANGGTQIHNLADAVDSHDAVNLGQLTTMLDDAVSSIAVNNIAVTNVTVNSANPMFSAEGSPTTDNALATGTHSVAAGANASAAGARAVALGAGSTANADDSMALGAGASASGERSVALGAGANVSAANATALGAGSSASADNSVALGQGSVADRANTVSVGAAGQERQITNVAAGVQGTDAVNVNQLNQGMSSAIGTAKAYTDNQISSVRKDGYGGAASAIAMAGLPQAVLPGRGMVALAAGTYGGQSAMALGVSQLSDTGKWAYKLQGTASTRGELGASIGAGMHW